MAYFHVWIVYFSVHSNTWRVTIWIFRTENGHLKIVMSEYYDAFVSCDIEDRIFVIQNLLPNLQKAAIDYLRDDFGE